MPKFAKLSSKGQLVIPKEYREKMKLHEGTVLAILKVKDDTLILKKVEDVFLKEDLELTKEVVKAWKEIERGEFTKLSKKEFLEELSKW